jgi:hypothetical protein
MHCSGSLLTHILLTWSIGWAPNNASKWQMEFKLAFKGLISYSCYMFRRMYVIIREPSFMCPAELHECAYGCLIYVKGSIHPVVLVNKTFKIPTVKSLNTDYIVVLISVLCPDGSKYICKNIIISEMIWAYNSYINIYNTHTSILSLLCTLTL